MPNGNHTSGMAPDQVISIIRNSHKFKKDIDRLIQEQVPHMIDIAVIKSQIAIIDMMMNNVNATDLSYLRCIRKGLVRNLDKEDQ